MTARIAPMILAIALSAMVCSSSAGYYAVDYQCSGYQELSTDGEFWLDTSFPYSGYGSVQMNNNGLVVATLDDSDAPHFGSGAVAIVTTGFEMNILYMPSCPGSSWVPAAQITWTWNAESGMWKTFGQPDGYPILPSNQIPEWDQVFIP